MSVEEYYINFTMLSRYAPSLVSNPSNGMNHFVMGFIDLVNKGGMPYGDAK